MKVIVTGGAGFIGSHLVDELLVNGHDITVLDNYSTGRFQNIEHVKGKIKIIECDLAEDGVWTQSFKGVDWVFHLAALADIVPSIQIPKLYFQANVDATFNVLQAAHKSSVKRFVYTASSSCYGIPDKYPTSEDADIRPEYPYALTKRMSEELVMHWGKIYQLPVISLRFFNVYGPKSRTSGTYGAVFGVFLAQKLAGMPFTIVGDGKQTRDFTYVSDIVNALLTSIQSNRSNEIYNVGSGKDISVNRLVDLLGGDKVYIPKRPGEPDTTFANIEKIKSHLNWKPTVSIEEGVAIILENIDYWREAPVWTPETIADATEDWFKLLKSDKNN
jgi:UDP-glucose 4-epimerase